MLLLAALAALVGAAAALSAAQPSQANLIMLVDPLARCLDGTQGGYYFSASLAPSGTNKWVVHFQGGGECVAKDTCTQATTSSLGSSKYFPASQWLGFYNSPFQSHNPDLWSWNHVLVQYCSQDLHSGQRNTTSPETFGLYFSGKFIVDAVLADLAAKNSFGSATDIVVAGDSAGGIATWFHVDDIAAKYPSARVVGAPIAGFYFPVYPYTGVNHTASYLAPFYPEALQGNYDLWQSHVDQSCAAAHAASPGMCLLANGSFPFISSHVFVTESQTDQVVLTAHDWVPAQYVTSPPELAYVNQWHNNMTVALQPVIYTGTTGQNGVFNPACFIHTSFNISLPLIDGISYLTAFGNWYFDRPGPKVLVDNCTPVHILLKFANSKGRDVGPHRPYYVSNLLKS